MIITISGKAGSGKSTIAKLLAKKLSLKHYSIGDLMRKLAKEKKISLLKLSRLAEKNPSIDRELDKKQIELKKEENFVIDGRLTAFFIPNADFKIFLDAMPEVRAKRIMNDQREEEKGKDIEEMTKIMEQREKSEKKRYKEYYNIDYYKKDLYNHMIDTTDLSVDEVIGKITDIIKKQKVL